MEKKTKKRFDDGLRWYHAAFSWMILLPLFLIAVTPEGFWTGWVLLIFLVVGLGGFTLIMKVPPKKIKDSEEDSI